MKNYLKNITLFHRDRIAINHKILIIGRGRWSQIIINELNSNFPNIEKIFVFSSNFKQEKSKNKKIIFINSLDLLKKQNIKYIIIANKNSDHFKYVKLFLKNKNNILCEKPLLVTKNKLLNLESRIKKNKCFLMISMQYFYAFYFNFINKNLVKNKKIKKIIIDWFDKKNEKRKGIIKNHDLKINFIEDIFYHVHSALYQLANIKEYLFEQKPLKEKNRIKVNFLTNNKIKTILNSSRNYTRRIRVIKIYFNNEDYLFLNFSKDSNIKAKLNGKTIRIPSVLMSKTIKYQLYFFLKQRKNDKKIELNNFLNLKKFFRNLYLLKEKL